MQLAIFIASFGRDHEVLYAYSCRWTVPRALENCTMHDRVSCEVRMIYCVFTKCMYTTAIFVLSRESIVSSACRFRLVCNRSCRSLCSRCDIVNAYFGCLLRRHVFFHFMILRKPQRVECKDPGEIDSFLAMQTSDRVLNLQFDPSVGDGIHDKRHVIL